MDHVIENRRKSLGEKNTKCFIWSKVERGRQDIIRKENIDSFDIAKCFGNSGRSIRSRRRWVEKSA